MKQREANLAGCIGGTPNVNLSRNWAPTVHSRFTKVSKHLKNKEKEACKIQALLDQASTLRDRALKHFLREENFDVLICSKESSKLVQTAAERLSAGTGEDQCCQ